MENPCTTRGNRAEHVVIDHATKWDEVKACADETAETTARFIFENVVCHHEASRAEPGDGTYEKGLQNGAAVHIGQPSTNEWTDRMDEPDQEQHAGKVCKQEQT